MLQPLHTAPKKTNNSWSVLFGSSINLGNMKTYWITSLWMDTFRWSSGSLLEDTTISLWGKARAGRYLPPRAAYSACPVSVASVAYQVLGLQFSLHCHEVPAPFSIFWVPAKVVLLSGCCLPTGTFIKHLIYIVLLHATTLGRNGIRHSFLRSGETEANIMQIARGLAFSLKPTFVLKPMNLTILLVRSSYFL